MPTKRPQPATKSQSHTDQAVTIYRQHLKQVEDGEHDPTRSWRQAVLDAFAQSIDTAPASLSNLFINAQRKVGLRVNRDFEIEPFGAAAPAPAPVDKPQKPPVVGASKVLALTDPGPAELTLVPKHGPITVPPKPVSKTPASTVGAPTAGVSTKAVPTAREKAEKVHADLIALCKDEIEEAFQTLEELIDNVDQLGDAKTLRKFTRQIRSACKRIEDQLGTKAMLDKKQANKILAGLEKGEK